MNPVLAQHLRETLPVPLSDDEVGEILTVFMEEFKSCSDELRALHDGTDFLSIRRITHAIKGFAANVGARDLYDLALSLNAAAHAADAPLCAERIRDILQLYSAYRAGDTAP